jgi:hypothetical protein
VLESVTKTIRTYESRFIPAFIDQAAFALEVRR